MKIGRFDIINPVIAAPMAGVSDKPFRNVCRANGAGLVVSEMVTSNVGLLKSRKTRWRMDHEGEEGPIVVQIVGTEPKTLAEAAMFNVDKGAQIIDINMGCPAKKVCKKLAGSALLANELLVANILTEVVEAVDVPVTLKIRTGTTPERKNALSIANIAEQSGIASLAIHGRTRACKFTGNAEYDTIAKVKQSINIPVVANGDITTPEKAKHVFDYTGADAVMIGRGAQGQPWLFQQVNDYLTHGKHNAPPFTVRADFILSHLREIHAFYGERMGIRFARKHIKWYMQHWPVELDQTAKNEINQTESADQQYTLVEDFLRNTLLTLACQQLAA